MSDAPEAPTTSLTVQFRSASSGKRLAEQEQSPTGSLRRRVDPESVDYERGEVIREKESGPQTPLSVEEADAGHLQVATPGGPIPVVEAESDTEANLYRVMYDDERLPSVEWELPSFNYYLPVRCPNCSGLSWGFHHAETQAVGDPSNTTSTGAVTPGHPRRTRHYIEYRCNECGAQGHEPTDKISNGGI